MTKKEASLPSQRIFVGKRTKKMRDHQIAQTLGGGG